MDENGDLLADSNYIINKWKNYFSQLLKVHSVSNVRQILRFEIEFAFAVLKKYIFS
jgi:hypothetical protein